MVRKIKETYVDGSLPEAQRQDLEAHLAICTECAARVALARRIQQELGPTLHQAIGEPRLSPAAESRIRARLWDAVESARPPASWRRWVTWGLAPTLALAAVVVVAVLVWPLLSPRLPATQQAYITPAGPDTPVPGRSAVALVPTWTPRPTTVIEPTSQTALLVPTAQPTQVTPPTSVPKSATSPSGAAPTRTQPAVPQPTSTPAGAQPTRATVPATPSAVVASGPTATTGAEMTSSGKWDRYLAGESVTCLALRSAQDDARRGMEVWAGTANGQVVRLNATDGALTRYTLSDQSAPVAGVAVDPAGRVWAATRGRGLFVFATPDATGTPAWQPYTAANSGLPSDVVSAVTVDAVGTVWCGTDTAVNRLTLKGTGVLTGTWQLFPVPIPASGPPMDQVTALTAEGTDTIWVGLLGNYRTELGRNVNGGLFRLTPGNPPTWERVLSDDVGTIRAIFVGPDGHKWVAVSYTGGTPSSARGGGVVVWNGEKWMLYEALGAGMPSRYVTGAAVDARGRTWVSTDKGLVVYEGTRRTIYQASASGLVSNLVTAIVLGEDGSAWIATDAGLCHLLEQ